MGRIYIRRNTSELYLPACIIERYSERTPRVMVWDAIAYYGRSQLQRTAGNFYSNKYIRQVLESEIVSLLSGIPGAG